jgi:hypothetical protein
MAVLTVASLAYSGITETLVAADVAGDTFANTGNEFIKVDNAGGAPIQVTPTVFGVLTSGQPITEESFTIPAGEFRLYGPFNRTVYNDPTGNVVINYSDITSVTVEAYRLPPTTNVGVGS